ncbi:MAG: hypothetical protein WAT79_06120 [Saprospiraceae bacterium]
MINHWFSDQKETDIVDNRGFFEPQCKDSHSHHELENYDLIFMTSQSEISKEARKNIQKLYPHYHHIKVLDAGMLLNTDYRFIQQPVAPCLEKGKISFILGGSFELAQSLAIKNKLKVTVVGNSIIPIDETLHTHSYIAYQRHLCEYKTLKFAEEFCPDSLSLGKIKSHPHLLEPILRDTEVLYVQLNVLRSSEIPGSTQSWPSGLNTEELCQILKYAGNSLQLKSVIIDFLGVSLSENQVESKLIAELYWYMLEGMKMRQTDHPVYNTNISEYIVNVADFDTELIFVRSNLSHRWWLRLDENETFPFISCAQEEYQMSIQNEVPERLLRHII